MSQIRVSTAVLLGMIFLLASQIPEAVCLGKPANSNVPTVLCGGETGKFHKHLIWLENRGLKIGLLPEVGGRVVYLGLKGHGNLLKSDSTLWREHPSEKPSMETVDTYKPYWGHMVWPSPMSEWWQGQDLYPQKKNDRWPPDPYLIYGAYKAESTGTTVTLTSPASPITGLQFTHHIEFTGENQLLFSVSARNTRGDSAAWGIWTNMQLPGEAGCYVPVSDADTSWFKKPDPASADTIEHLIKNGYFTFRPGPSGTGQAMAWTKACIHPSENWMAAFSGDQMVLIEFPHANRGDIHPEQEQVEVFNMMTPDGEGNLLELETHSAYKILQPGEETRTWNRWTVFHYQGDKTEKAHIDFLRKLTASLSNLY